VTKTAQPATRVPSGAKADGISNLLRRKTRNEDEKTATAEDPPADLVRKAIQDLGLDTPYYTCRVVGRRLEFVLATGAIAYWPPTKGDK